MIFHGNSVAETLLDELEFQCRSITTNKQKSNDESISSKNRRHSTVDYSWLTPTKHDTQVKSDSYRLPEMIKMELTQSIHDVAPDDCLTFINRFRRQIRSQTGLDTPENVIVLFRRILFQLIDEKKR